MFREVMENGLSTMKRVDNVDCGLCYVHAASYSRSQSYLACLLKLRTLGESEWRQPSSRLDLSLKAIAGRAT